MNDSFFVGSRETFGDLQRILDRFALWQRSARHPFAQRFAFKQFRDDVRRAFMRADVIDDQDVRMIECAGSLRFLFKAPQPVFVF